MPFQPPFIHRIFSLGTIVCILSATFPAIASEQAIIKYKIVRESISVRELSTFAETGELSSSLRNYLRMARQNPKLVRTALNFETKIDIVLLDRILNSPIGNIILDRISQIIRTPSNQTNRAALRAALILSAKEDNSISLMEAIENYPTREMLIDGDRLVRAYRNIISVPKKLTDLLL